jgi:hypothetical protein
MGNVPERTHKVTDKSGHDFLSVVGFTDYGIITRYPTDKSVGYSHSLARTSQELRAKTNLAIGWVAVQKYDLAQPSALVTQSVRLCDSEVPRINRSGDHFPSLTLSGPTLKLRADKRKLPISDCSPTKARQITDLSIMCPLRLQLYSIPALSSGDPVLRRHFIPAPTRK